MGNELPTGWDNQENYEENAFPASNKSSEGKQAAWVNDEQRFETNFNDKPFVHSKFSKANVEMYTKKTPNSDETSETGVCEESIAKGDRIALDASPISTVKYVYEKKQNHSSKTIILVLIFLVVFVIMGVGIFFLLNCFAKQNEGNDSNIASKQLQSEEVTVSTQLPIISDNLIASDQQTEPDITTTIQTSATTKTQTSQVVFSRDINDYPLYLNKLRLIAQNTGVNYNSDSGLSIAYAYSENEYGYSLQDLNTDGIPELIISEDEGDGSYAVIEIYVILNNQLAMLCQTQERLYYVLCENNVISVSSLSGETTFYKYNGGDKLENIATISDEYLDNGKQMFYLNGNPISKSEADKTINLYQPITIETIPISNVVDYSLGYTYNVICNSNSELHAVYADIAFEIEDDLFISGLYLIDLDKDGYDEMILPDSSNNSFKYYYYDNGQICSENFGEYMALGNFNLYAVTGDDGERYIYYRDEYCYKSYQGYHRPKSQDTLYIWIDYPEQDQTYYADWKIYNEHGREYTLVSSGKERVTSFYAQPAECHSELISAFNTCKYNIREESKYTKIKSQTLETLKAKDSVSVTNSSLGDMYNLFYYQTLIICGSGCLIDKNGDGIEELLLSNYGGSYTIYTYQNGNVFMSYDNTPYYAGLLDYEQLRALCKEKAVEHGFTLNSDFVQKQDIIGYVKTEGGMLNLRSATSTNSDIVVQIPNHTFFNVYQDPENILDYWGTPEWYYISVSVNGRMYSGYVSSEYVDVWNTTL